MKVISRRRPRPTSSSNTAANCAYKEQQSFVPHETNNNNMGSCTVNRVTTGIRCKSKGFYLLLATVWLMMIAEAASFAVGPAWHALPLTGYVPKKKMDESEDDVAKKPRSSAIAFVQPYSAARRQTATTSSSTQLQAFAIAESGSVRDSVSSHRLQQEQLQEPLNQRKQRLGRRQKQEHHTAHAAVSTKQQKQQQSTPSSSSSCPAEAWARKYTSVDALRETFGGNKNPLWGDLDATSARKLYKTLLPRALLELHQYYSRQLDTASVATDLAPLAYQARVAAKLYTRERCRLPVRVVANLYDGFRQWRKTGHFNMHGMSYAEVWDKYANDITAVENADHLSPDELAAKIGLKILERACVTNPVVDKLVLRTNNKNKKKRHPLSTAELQQITAQLEEDVERLLWPAVEEWEHSHAATGSRRRRRGSAGDVGGTRLLPPTTTTATPANRYRTLRQLALMKRNLSRLKPQPTPTTESSPLSTGTLSSKSTTASSKHPWQEQRALTPRPRPWQDRPRPQRPQ